jgi:hypothetical protein
MNNIRRLLCGITLIQLFGISCGVKGRPQIPDYPPDIGRGLVEQELPSPSPLPIVNPVTLTPLPTPLIVPSNKTK